MTFFSDLIGSSLTITAQVVVVVLLLLFIRNLAKNYLMPERKTEYVEDLKSFLASDVFYRKGKYPDE